MEIECTKWKSDAQAESTTIPQSIKAAVIIDDLVAQQLLAPNVRGVLIHETEQDRRMSSSQSSAFCKTWQP